MRKRLIEKFAILATILKSRAEEVSIVENGVTKCKGNLVHSNIVLTATHCEVNYNTIVLNSRNETGFIDVWYDHHLFDDYASVYRETDIHAYNTRLIKVDIPLSSGPLPGLYFEDDPHSKYYSEVDSSKCVINGRKLFSLKVLEQYDVEIFTFNHSQDSDLDDEAPGILTGTPVMCEINGLVYQHGFTIAGSICILD